MLVLVQIDRDDDLTFHRRRLNVAVVVVGTKIDPDLLHRLLLFLLLLVVVTLIIFVVVVVTLIIFVAVERPAALQGQTMTTVVVRERLFVWW